MNAEPHPDLTAAPYGLDDGSHRLGARAPSTRWTEDEKVGQLFINLNNRFDDEFVNQIVDSYHPGGMRYNHTDSASIQAHIRHAQSRSKVPLLVASNIEAGGNGACTDGTLRRHPVADRLHPRHRRRPPDGPGRRSGVAGAGLQLGLRTDRGHPLNWRNTVVATRAFGNDHETVITYAQAYLRWRPRGRRRPPDGAVHEALPR